MVKLNRLEASHGHSGARDNSPGPTELRSIFCVRVENEARLPLPAAPDRVGRCMRPDDVGAALSAAGARRAAPAVVADHVIE